MISNASSSCNMPGYSAEYSQQYSRNNSSGISAFNLSMPIKIELSIYVDKNISWWSSPAYRNCSKSGSLLKLSTTHESTYVSNNNVYIQNLTEMKGMQVNSLSINGIYYQKGENPISVYSLSMPYQNSLIRVYIWGVTGSVSNLSATVIAENILVALRPLYKSG